LLSGGQNSCRGVQGLCCQPQGVSLGAFTQPVEPAHGFCHEYDCQSHRKDGLLEQRAHGWLRPAVLSHLAEGSAEGSSKTFEE